MVLEVGLNLGCALELALDRKAGPCRLISLVSIDVDNLTVHIQAERSHIVEFIRTLPKTDFRDVVDHSTSQR
jgi:hypothetical protein